MKAVILLDNNLIDSNMFIRAIVFAFECYRGGKMAMFVTPLKQCDPIKLTFSITYTFFIFQI